MNFDLELDHRMIRDLVARFVKDELIPLEAAVMAREADGQRFGLLDDERAHSTSARDSSAQGPRRAARGRRRRPAGRRDGRRERSDRRDRDPYILPPDSPNLRMLCEVADDAQRARYLDPYARGVTRAAMAISEPGAGSDPGALSTTAVRDGDSWVLNGRKIWISHATEADWTIVMALTDRSKGKRGGMSAFIVDRDTPGFVIERRIPMIGGLSTYEIVLENCRLPAAQLLGRKAPVSRRCRPGSRTGGWRWPPEHRPRRARGGDAATMRSSARPSACRSRNARLSSGGSPTHSRRSTRAAS